MFVHTGNINGTTVVFRCLESELPNTAHSCSQYDLATAWLMLELPGNINASFKSICSGGGPLLLGCVIKQLGQLIQQGRLL